MEQDQEARDLEQVEAWVEEAAWAGEALVVVDREVVLRQARAVIVSALIVVKEQPINWGPPVMSRNAQNVERP